MAQRHSGLIVVGALVLVALASCATRGPATRSAAASAPSARSAFVGDWTGAIAVGAQGTHIVVHLSRDSSGTFRGTIDIPQQSARGLPLSAIVVEGNRISFSLNAGSDIAHFAGTLAAGAIAGDFAQGPAHGTFKLAAAAAAAGRATEPGKVQGAPAAAPVEADGTTVALHTATGTLYGTLDLPKGAGPFPVALLISGSGPTDRDGNSPLLPGKNDSLKKLAVALKTAGVASVRYDKRGIGQSAAAAPEEAALRFDTYIDDAVAWIKLLAGDPRFTKVAVIGHSEGSLIGMIAARRAGAAAFVSIAGAGAPADVVLKRQLAGQPEPLRGEAFRIIDRLVAGRTVAKVDPRLMALFRPSVQPYLISWFRYDPSAEIAKLRIPVLIVQGTTDLQVDAGDAERLHAAAPGSQLAIVEGMNHVLVESPANREENLATYGNPRLPLAPSLVGPLVEFLRKAIG